MIRIFVPRDAAAVACGADGVAAAIRGTAQRAGIEVAFVRTGSRGMLWLEPLVEVEDGGVRHGFGPLDHDGAVALVMALAEGRGAAAITHPAAVGAVERHPVASQGQTRLTFARCGVIDPVSWGRVYRARRRQGTGAGAGDGAGGDRRRGHGVGAARARRRGFPDRHQVEDGG